METQTKAAIVATIAAIIVAAIFGPIVVSSNGTEDTVVNVNQTLENNNTNIITITKDDIRSKINLEFSDYFSEDNSNWHINPNSGRCEISIDGGKLIFNKISDESCVIFYSDLKSYTPPENFIVEFEAKIERNKNDGHIGIILRKIDDDNYYRFLISRDGYYKFEKQNNDHFSPIISWTSSSLINEGTKTNIIKVKCEGNIFTFYINNVEIDSCADSTFANGDIALAAGVCENSLTGNKFSFDNFKIWSIKY